MPVTAHNETERLSALHRLHLLDTPPEPAFERLVTATATLFGVPISLVSLVDTDRQWFKARCGLDASETDRDLAFCNYTILHDTVFVVPDATADPLFAQNPLVTGEPGIRFYAGAPLILRPGIRLGSLCIIDTQTRSFNEADAAMLSRLARMVVDELWLRNVLPANLTDTPDEFAPTETDTDLDDEPILTGAQLRAARALADWSIADLTAASNVSPNTIKRLEAQHGRLAVRSRSLTSLRLALEQHGIRFTGCGSAAPGVQHKLSS
ncbi:GAF domain-containing protein [Methylobacterium sp. P31]